MHIHMIGIKGTGMASLAGALQRFGAVITGSDRDEVFYTDEILNRNGIPFCSGFSPDNIPESCDLVVCSPAYRRDQNVELDEAYKRKIRTVSYVDMLAELSAMSRCCAVAGTHGKTSTNAMIDSILDHIGIQHVSIYGSVYSGSTGSLHSGLSQESGRPSLFIEACEYRDHFQSYAPDCIVLTSISYDHPDYFPDLQAVLDVFVAFALKLPIGGTLIYCSDDANVMRVQMRVEDLRPDISMVPYGLSADGAYKITSMRTEKKRICFSTSRHGSLALSVPGTHMAENMCGALAAVEEMFPHIDEETLVSAVAAYRGSARRAEMIGTAGGVTIVDDYGHHPDEIRVTLHGLKEFYQPDRVVVDFIPHTFSRTETMITEFSDALDAADLVIIHPVYSSPREEAGHEDSADALSRALADSLDCGIFLHVTDSLTTSIQNLLKPGDLFITMGAGNNRWIGQKLYNELSGLQKEEHPR